MEEVEAVSGIPTSAEVQGVAEIPTSSVFLQSKHEQRIEHFFFLILQGQE